MAELQASGFGQRPLQHGLWLLGWFPDQIDFMGSEHELCFNPNQGEFGSRKFYNRTESDGSKLLPDDGLQYYEVGNLNREGANKLPEYVRKNYTRKDKDSNTNRIIFNLNENGYIGKVYVTEHSDERRFNPDATFCIDIDLLKTIKSLEVKDFFSRMVQY
ncbi:hypothetical protein Q7C36_007457 [Tachysurus vachellii]|uniref:Uncharacterized protein n=1 Tax=Tachysurus vachellii TaxID=175792 RepID=A0AA88SZI8_TACVA|nr:hypothetical protein Q7C36_007457 [Tachysurus vachellii]